MCEIAPHFSIPILSNQERELHKVKVNSARSRAGSRMSVSSDKGETGKATVSKAARNKQTRQPTKQR